MSFETTTPLFTPSATALLRAISAPDDLTGIAHSLPIILSCVHAAAELWPNEPLKKWVEVTEEMQRRFSAAKSLTDGVTLHFFNKPVRPTKTYEQFMNWRVPALRVGPAFDAHALLGRAVIQSASMNRVIPSDLMSGLQTLARARRGKGRGSRSEDWEQLLPLCLARSDDLKTVMANLPQKSPALGFITASISVLDTVCVAPDLMDDVSITNPENKSEDRSAEDKLAPDTSGNTQAKPTESAGNDDDDQDAIPDITTRLAAADRTYFGEKLGFYHRDQLLVGDLVAVTQQFPKLLQEGTPREKGFTLLATLSLVTGCTDTMALQLQFRPMHSIWLDLGRGAWAWDFNAYRASKGDLSDAGVVQPIFCSWPAFVDGPLNAANDASPDAKTFKDLILKVQNVEHFDLKGYRQFLRNCGHPSHPPYRGRFARSLPSVYLELTGSDMTSAMMTGFFAAAAPAALFYFGPTYKELESRVTQVYAKLGFGPPSTRRKEPGRAGCQKVLEVDELRKCWKELTQAINAARVAALSATDPESIRGHCNRWMALLGTAFVIQSAHRSTRLECLTAGALYLHSDVMVIHDKDEGDRVQPRLVPKTAAIQKILLSAAECSKLIHTLIGTNDAELSFALGTADTVFRQFEVHKGVVTPVVLHTADVAAITKEYFQATANFGRSTWVTYLDENKCDRWLIRSLTGHTRDVTRVHGPYFDVPPLVVASRLGLQMELTGMKVFGPTDISISTNEPPQIKIPILNRQRIAASADGPVPDPRTILDPLSVETLAEWRVSDLIRKDLVAGRIDAPPSVLVALHLLFIDQIPVADLCISAVTDKNHVIKHYFQRAGLNWARSHFIHPTWLPIQPTTYRLIEQVNEPAISKSNLIALICTALRETHHCRLPGSDKACWGVIASMGGSYRRLSYPPSISAISDLAVPAPCLSTLSLQRFSGMKTGVRDHTRPVKVTAAKSRQKNEDARLLIHTLGKYSSTTERHGEKVNRAKLCLHDLDNRSMAWSPFVAWIKDWVVDELRRTRELNPRSYQISSIETYTSTLLTASGSISTSDDPYDWEDHEWMAWVWQTDHACGGKQSVEATDKEDPHLTERAKHAIQALVTSLTRRQYYVPVKLRALLGDSIKVRMPHGSASACLISARDRADSVQVMKDWNQDYPSDFALGEMRATVSGMFPSRSGEISSLSTNCLTPGGGLVMERAGYDLHKSGNAIRVIPLSEDNAKKLLQMRAALQSFFGERPLLLRNDGSPEAGLRDERIAREWATALKQVTGDPQAKPHSVRAATLQEIAWPDWQQNFLAWACNEAGPLECKSWVQEQEKDYCRLATAVSLAGQGDLRPAFGHYLAGWPMVYALLASASLQELTPGSAFLEQLGVPPAGLRQARSRARRQSSDEMDSLAEFDPWHWVMNQLTRPPTSQTVKGTDVVSNSPVTTLVSDEPPARASELEELRYVTIRLLGVPAERAVEKLAIPFRVTSLLEKALLPESLIATAVTRGRQGPGDRGKAADIVTALSDQGLLVLSWLRSLQTEDFTVLKQALFRGEPYLHPMLEKVKFWQQIAQSIPTGLSIHVRIGSKYLTTAEISAMNQLAPALNLIPDPRIGERPVVSFHERGIKNFVTSARLTAVARTSCLAIHCLRHTHISGELHAR